MSSPPLAPPPRGYNPPLLVTHANPYVGPRAFTAGERLFGRDRELADLVDLVIAERIVLLHAPSGAGKSSLLQAGLTPRLRAEGLVVLPVARVGLPPPIACRDRFTLSVLLGLEEDVPKDRQTPLAALAERLLTLRPGVAVGLFAGALTNTPALAGVLELIDIPAAEGAPTAALQLTEMKGREDRLRSVLGKRAAKAAAPAPSATLCVSVNKARMAAATSLSLTCTMWSMCGAMMASAAASATRQAMPSASWVVTGASTTLPAASESA